MHVRAQAAVPPGDPAALEKAHRYRLLNEPAEAESICRDVLEIDPDNQQALIALALALSDQLDDNPGAVGEAREFLERVADEYARLYYGGILIERRAKTTLHVGGPGSGSMAYDYLRRRWSSSSAPSRCARRTTTTPSCAGTPVCG